MSSKTVACFSCGAVAALVGVIVFIIAFDQLDPNEMGFVLNNYRQRIEEEKGLTVGGRHLLGPTKSFVKFPTTGITADWTSAAENAIPARTRDGLTVQLDCTMVYQIQQDIDAVLSIYANHTDTGYEDFVLTLGRTTLRDVAAQFEAFDYFTQRQNVSNALGNAMEAAIDPYFFSMITFELTNYALPDAFNAAVLATTIAREGVTTAENEAEKNLVQAQTRQTAAIQEANTIASRASTNAQEVEAVAEAAANSTIAAVREESAAYQAIAAAFPGFGAEEILAYNYIKTIEDFQGKHTLSIHQPSVLDFPDNSTAA